MLNKKLCSFSGLFMAIILGVAPAYAAETTTESMTGTSAVNNVSQSAVSTTVSSQMSQDYINSAINNNKSDSIMTDTSVIDGRTGGYDKNVASSWLEDALSTVKVEGIDTSKYNIVIQAKTLIFLMPNIWLQKLKWKIITITQLLRQRPIRLKTKAQQPKQYLKIHIRMYTRALEKRRNRKV